MDARFQVANPKGVLVTLTLTATMAEFMQLRDALPDDLVGNEFASGDSFWRKLNALIQSCETTLAADRWTTGYSTGVVEKEESE